MDDLTDDLASSSFDDETKARLKRIKKRVADAVPSAPTENLPVSVEPIEKIGPQMAFWPEDAAASPTELSRVALFTLPSDKRGVRKMMDAVKLDSRNGVEVFYSGKQLGVKEETTWYASLRMCRGVPIGSRVYFNLVDLLREMKLANTGGKRGNRISVQTRLDRLSGAHFKINFTRGGNTYSITTGMLKWGIEHETGRMYMRLDPDGALLFENLAYQPWDIRLSLKSDVAARMLTYISGHMQGKPHSVRLNDLRAWCGYEGRLRQFRTQCLHALEELEEKGVLVKGKSMIRDDAHETVSWVRTKTTPGPPTAPAVAEK